VLLRALSIADAGRRTCLFLTFCNVHAHQLQRRVQSVCIV
jgi:hypothetical protein